MPKILLAIAAIAVGILIWNLQPADPAGQDHPDKSLAKAAGEATPNPTTTNMADRPDSAASDPSRPSADAGAAASATAASSLSGKEIADLGMTRELAGIHLVTMDGRQHRVLGSKEVADQSGKNETMLLIRDELSGQISYRLSGLQFTLKDGVDYEAFIREHRAMRRLFVNPLYAQVAVDAAEIAEQYSALGQDSRVAKLRFMTRAPVIKPK